MNRYINTPTETSPSGDKIYKVTKYPTIPRTFEDLYIYTTIGDRFDTLAQQYYGDSSLWWIISICNDNLPQNSLNPPVGTQLRIPPNPNPIVAAFEKLNESSTSTITQPSFGGSGY
jgi:hypothetical protein|tara:strand:+ start:831 stop:1178 length:348 start_codon:yes stop_codon:yes gene_type:complete